MHPRQLTLLPTSTVLTFIVLGISAAASGADFVGQSSVGGSNPVAHRENPFRQPEWLTAQAAQDLSSIADDASREEPEFLPEPDREGAESIDPISKSASAPIGTLGVDIGLPPGKLPENRALESVATAPLFVGSQPRPWPTNVYQWQAAATRHQPLYFEEINAERYGYSCNWVLQPVVSTAHFFATIPALPYLKATNCPGECQYTLGHYRPGSCNPQRRHCWPCSRRGWLAEAGAAWWLVVVLP